MKISTTGTRECIDETVGCGVGFFPDDQRICQPCNAACTTCNGKGDDQCTSCPAGKVLQPMQKMRIQRKNQENMVNAKEKTEEDLQEDPIVQYEIDPEMEFSGKCGDNCDLKGFAAFNKEGVCTLCEPDRCAMCDTTGK